MIPFKFVGQHSLVFEFGTLHPDDEFEIPEDRVEAYRHRPDMECLDSAAMEAFDAARAAELAELAKSREPVVAPIETPSAPEPPAPPTRGSKATDPNAKSDDSGEAASKQE